MTPASHLQESPMHPMGWVYYGLIAYLFNTGAMVLTRQFDKRPRTALAFILTSAVTFPVMALALLFGCAWGLWDVITGTPQSQDR